MSVRTKPRYQQVKELIMEQITDGRLRPTDRVPSENELVETTGVSRMTANRALRELTKEGYLERVAGSGTFVADLRAASHLLEVRNIAEEIAHRGHRHTSNVVRLEATAADAATAAALRLKRRRQVFHVMIVHCEDGVPIQLEDRYVVKEFAPDFLAQDFSRQTPSGYLSEISPLQEAEHVVRAELPSPRVAAELKMDENEPCLVVTRRTWGAGRPVTFGRLFHPGSRFELAGHFVPPGTQSRR